MITRTLRTNVTKSAMASLDRVFTLRPPPLLDSIDTILKYGQASRERPRGDDHRYGLLCMRRSFIIHKKRAPTRPPSGALARLSPPF